MDKPALSRRGFVKGASVLTFGFAVIPANVFAAAREPVALSPNALLRIETDNTVRIFMPNADLGSGIYTGMAQIVADELDADWSAVVTEHLNSLDDIFKNDVLGTIATGASTSVTLQWNKLREAGATARAMLIQAAANEWGVPAQTLSAENSMVIDKVGGRKAKYGDLTNMAARLTPPAKITLKNPEQFKFIGLSLDRLDRAAKCEGSTTFGMDVQLPGMLYAAIAHAPVFGATVTSFDANAARLMPGVLKVVEIPTGVAVVAETFWQAKKAKDELEILWDNGAFESVSSADLWHEYGGLAKTEGHKVEQRGQIDFDQADSHIDGEIRFPFLAHAPMEPLNATAQVNGDRCVIWTGTQFQGFDVVNIEKFTGIKVSNITINAQWLGGSFGRRASPHADFLVEAVQIAQASDLPNPIKMIWQREDDIQGGLYRPMALHRYRIGVDADGMPAHWQHRVVCASITVGTPIEGLGYANGFDVFSVTGLINNLYAGANVDFQLHTPAHAVAACWLRGEGDSHNGPAVETIINRLARHTNSDPFAYRRKLLAGKAGAARVLGVLSALEIVSNWAEAPPPGVFRGIAIHASFGSVCGYVVELRKTGTHISFRKVTAAFDCGLVINPNSVKAQVYSSVAFALSTILGQKIEIEHGRASQSNFHDYKVAQLSHVPDVDVHLVDNGLDHPTGVGEVGVSPFIPALTEAVYAAVGQEVNEFPMHLDGYTFLDA